MSVKLAADISPPLSLSDLMPVLDSYLLKFPENHSALSDIPAVTSSSFPYEQIWKNESLEGAFESLVRSTRIEPETFTLETGDVLRTRNALKLATKFFSDNRLPWSASESMESCAHVAEVGTLLALSNAHPEVIQAGFLYPTLLEGGRIDSERAGPVIEKKFGKEVLNLVARTSSLLELRGEDICESLLATREHDPALARRLASLHCAVICARSPSKENDASLGRTYQLCGVSESLLNQFHIDGGRPMEVSPSNQDQSPYSLHDIVDIRNSLRCAAVVFQDSLRRWGPSEKIPLISHAAEVGLLLVLAGRSRDIVVAGLLHDFLEGYAEGKNISHLANIVEKYGPHVYKMVGNITEPNRSEIHGKTESRESWLNRKLTIVKRIVEGNPEFAELVAATKISTLAAGNKMLFENGAFDKWSNGSCRDNIAVFVALCEASHNKNIHPLLSDQLELEIDRLILQAGRLPSAG